MIQVVIALLIGGSLYDIITGSEHWPFSPYAMFSNVEREPFMSRHLLFGVTEQEPGDEITLQSFQYIRPFMENRLNSAFRRMKSEPDGQQLLTEALHDCLTRYERLRLAGCHDGPPLQGIRLYWLQWKLDPWAKNVHQPDRRKLLAEVMRWERRH